MTTPTRPPFIAPPSIATPELPPASGHKPDRAEWAIGGGSLVAFTLVGVLLANVAGWLGWWALVGIAVDVALLVPFGLAVHDIWRHLQHSGLDLQARRSDLWARQDAQAAALWAFKRAVHRMYPRTGQAAPDHIDAIPVNRGGQVRYSTRVVDAVVTPEPAQPKSGDTQRLTALPDYDWPGATKQVYECGCATGSTAWRTVHARYPAITQLAWERACDWLDERGGILGEKAKGKSREFRP